MKRIISLLLILVLALGCLGVTASATPTDNYPPIDTISIGGYLTALNATSNNDISFTVRIPNAGSTVTNAAVVVDPVNSSSFTAVTVAGTALAYDSATGNWTGTVPSLSTVNSSSIVLTFGGTPHTYTLYVIAGTGQAQLSSLVAEDFNTTGNQATVSYGSITVGGVTRYTASVQLPNGTSASALTSLELKAIGLNCSSTFKLDGNSITGNTFTANFTAQTHTLTVVDGNDSRDYLLSACAPDANGDITVYIGVRTWAAYDYNNNIYTHYDYASNGYGSGSGTTSINTRAKKIDTVGMATGTIAQPTWTSTTVNNSTVYRPVFATTQYVPMLVPAGSSARDVLDTYASSHSITINGSNSYVSGITWNNYSLDYSTCGYGAGWMYLVRYSNTDVTTDLPNLAANNYIVTGGQYIDWVYTCAYGQDFGYSMW